VDIGKTTQISDLFDYRISPIDRKTAETAGRWDPGETRCGRAKYLQVRLALIQLASLIAYSS
jgi:hypothetical protein